MPSSPLRDGIGAVLDLLFPEPCPGCGGLRGLGLQMPLCAECEAELPTQLRSFEAPECVAGAWALGPYEGALGKLVREGKYRSDVGRIDALGHRLAVACEGRLPGVDLVTWVPTAARRRWTRGFDQSERLARPVARALGVHPRPVLWRRRAAEQAGRSRAERLAGARGAFRTRGVELGGARVLLVDDVCTTGATAAACAVELLGHGATAVVLVTVAAVDL